MQSVFGEGYVEYGYSTHFGYSVNYHCIIIVTLVIVGYWYFLKFWSLYEINWMLTTQNCQKFDYKNEN